MKNFNGNVLQKSISRVFPSKIVSDVIEVIFLLLMGMLAVTLHSKLRMPMQLPGKHGLLFMFLIVTARSMSRFPFAASLTSLGAASLLFMNVLGFDDPYMPVIYVILGIVMDVMFGFISTFKPSVFLIALASGLSWAAIPVLRILITTFTGFPYNSLMKGFAFPLFTHFIAGFIGGLIGAAIVSQIRKKQSS